MADALQYYTSLVDCLRKKQIGQEQVEIAEAILRLDLKSLQIKLQVAEAIFAEGLKEEDLYKAVCSSLSDSSGDSVVARDVKSIVQWLCNRYPKRWEAYELLASILHRSGERSALEQVVSRLETIFKELGMYDQKKDLLAKYKRKAVSTEVVSEALDDTHVSAKTPLKDQVKISLEANVYDILKRKAQEDGTFDEEMMGADREGGVSQKVGFEDLFQNFKQDLEAKVPKGDYETHYNLGIAYREMSLHEDAIKEFEIALEDPRLRYDCYYMIGQSWMDLKHPEEAIARYEQAMALKGLDPEKILGLRYELALALLATGKRKEALDYFKEILRLRGDYRDVAKRIKALQGGEVS
jgi:tetratricopeptide (TPR) repeat protein